MKNESQLTSSTAVVLCGIIPILFVAYSTAPFVTHIHMHLPPYARASRPILERFISKLPSSTPLTLTTMSVIGKPRYSSLQAGELVPVRRRFGLVNFVRDTAAENATRKWYMFRAVRQFYVQERRIEKRVRYETKKDRVETWIWNAVAEKLAKKARVGAS